MGHTAFVNLNDLMDALDLQSEFLSFFVDVSTGEILPLVEEEKEGLQKDLFKEISLDIDQGVIGKNFCKEVDDAELKELFLSRLQEENGLEAFLVAVQMHQKEEDWLQYIEKCLKEIAIAWCEENGLLYKDIPREEEF